MDPTKERKERKPYYPPAAIKLTRETAKLRLLGRAMMGHQGAMELLERMFEDEAPGRDSSDKKKSA